MKVTKTDGAKGVSSTRKAKKTTGNDGGFADALRDVSGAEESGQAQATGGVGPVASILAAQQTADATDHKSRGLMMNYGNDLLDRLEQIRISVLSGSVSKDRLQDLARRLRERKTTSDDPRLNDLIGEVELRVEVEIAKLTR
ncbi:flagellar assembly protein FliX [Thalassospiraceae bacterium LMO-JJ14]|nr:flagellar assembly protein FliX [Thalassospiraceae bacterium LMO-JJ14]